MTDLDADDVDLDTEGDEHVEVVVAGPAPDLTRTDADRAHTLARCVGILERRGVSARHLRRLLAQLRPGQPEPTREEMLAAPVKRKKSRWVGPTPPYAGRRR